MAAAASGGVGIGHLLRKSMGALKAEIDSARDKTTEGLTICPTHDGVAVQAVMGFGHGITSKVTHGTELYDAVYMILLDMMSACRNMFSTGFPRLMTGKRETGKRRSMRLLTLLSG